MGVFSYQETPKEMMPDINVPMILVSSTLQGISPQDSERLLVRPMEDTLSTVEGIKEIHSTATDGLAHIILEFNAGFDSAKALSDVRAKVDDIVADIPKDATRPIVKEVNLSLFPILNIALVSDLPERTLISIARQLKKHIESIPEVLKAEIAGLRKEVVDIIIEPRILSGYDLKIEEVLQAIDMNNRLVTAGNMENGYSVRVNGILENTQDILNTPVKVMQDTVLTVKDVAEIRSTFEEPKSFTRINGKPAIVLEISKRSGKNLLDTVEKIKDSITELQPMLPKNLNIVYSLDQSSKVKDVLHDLENNILIATILVLIIIFTCMGYKAAILVALAIPGSFYVGLIFISYLGMTMNIVVLFSLIMSVGMLVDAAIVVNEYADRKMIIGMNKFNAYKTSAMHMLWPVVSSTVTTLVVFTPLLFWPGMVGQFMKYLPITLIATLSGSVLMSLIFTPVLGGIFGGPSTNDPKVITRMKAIDNGDTQSLGPFMKLYSTTLQKVLNKPIMFILMILATLCTSIILYFMFGQGLQFFPKVEPEVAILQVRAKGNLSIYERDNILKSIENKILDSTQEIKVFYSKAGNFNDAKFFSDDVIGSIQIEFIDWKYRRSATNILNDIDELLKEHPGVIIELQEEKKGPSDGGKPIKIDIGSYFPNLLPTALDQVIEIMEEVGGFTSIEDSRSSPEIEWNITIDREKAALSGTNIALIGEYIKMLTKGARIGSYRPDNTDEEVDILARLPKKNRNITQLDSLFVNGHKGLVPISNFINLKPQEKVKKLERVDSLPILSINADIKPGLLVSNQIQKLQKALLENRDKFDHRINIKFKGEIADQKEAQKFLSRAFILALLGVILILVIQFNSYYYAFVIMTAVFLSTTGVLIGLLITGNSFVVVMCGVGIIALAGIVVNNNILLIDAFKINLDNGCNYKDAIIRSAVSRVKPILMTAGTTVLGLLPMVTKVNLDIFNFAIYYNAPSSQWWVHLSTTIAGGLFFATILTLFFTPALLMLKKH